MMTLAALLLTVLLLANAVDAWRIGTSRSTRVAARWTMTAQEQQLGRVTMYKKETCPYCKKARELLEGKYGLSISYVDVETAPADKRDEILHQMRTFSGGRNTVPQIFFNSDHLGGNDDVQKLEADGKLSALVDLVRKTESGALQEGWYHPWY
jgi:glutaredoxin 3